PAFQGWPIRHEIGEHDRGARRVVAVEKLVRAWRRTALDTARVRGVCRLKRQQALDELEATSGALVSARCGERWMSGELGDGTLGERPRNPAALELFGDDRRRRVTEQILDDPLLPLSSKLGPA